MKYLTARPIKNSDNESSEFLSINNCGAFVDTTEPIITTRPVGRFDYQIIYIKKGNIEIYENGKTTTVSSGGLVLFRPHEPQMYTALRGCTFYWIHFSGTAAESMLSFFEERYLSIGSLPEIEEFCDATISSFTSQKQNYSLFCAGKLISLIAVISQKMNSDVEGEDELIGAAVLDMHKNFTIWRTNDEYAEMCGLSKSHFIRIFHKNLGMPPQKYRASVAMREAKHLLKSNSVTSTASILGYTDVFYFSRVFKKFIGVSPNEYKRQYNV